MKLKPYSLFSPVAAFNVGATLCGGGTNCYLHCHVQLYNLRTTREEHKGYFNSTDDWRNELVVEKD